MTSIVLAKEEYTKTDLDYFKWFYKNQYYLRMQCSNFLIAINKETNEYKNIYALDNNLGREFLKELAEEMTKHKNMK